MKARMIQRGLRMIAMAGCSTLLWSGCGGDSQIQTYRVPKENQAQAPAAAIQEGSTPHVHAEPPPGWQEAQPTGMRAATYRISGEDGKMAEVVVIPLRGANKIQLESVNMWRDELQLPPVSLEQLKELAEPVEVGNARTELFDLVSAKPKAGQKFNSRTLGVVFPEEDTTWIVKMVGDDLLVAREKSAFTNFLKSLSFHDSAHAAAGQRPSTTNTNKVPASAQEPRWSVPANWTQKPPGPMIMTAFQISGDGQTQAEVTISKLPGDGGGMAPNINRWRGQLGLNPLSESDFAASVQWLEIDGKKESYVVDLSGTSARTGKAARMVAVGVPRSGETWFFKLMGDDPVVAKEKDAFIRFIQSAY